MPSCKFKRHIYNKGNARIQAAIQPIACLLALKMGVLSKLEKNNTIPVNIFLSSSFQIICHIL
jgi:hypothetical protein